MIEEFNVTLNIDVSEATKSLEKYMAVLYGTLGIMRRMGLPEEMTAAIRWVQRAIASLNMLRASLIAVQVASGPVGWAMAFVSVTGTIMTLTDVSG